MTLFEFFNLPEEERTALMLQVIEKSIEAQLESLKQIQEDIND